MVRLQKVIIVSIIMLMAWGLVGCGGEGPESLFETAQFEEKQNNKAHAQQLYEQIIRSYPDSKFAKLAKTRLEEFKQSAGINMKENPKP